MNSDEKETFYIILTLFGNSLSLHPLLKQIERCIKEFWLRPGEGKQMGEKLKVAWDKFSTLS
jgi:hypothetical protein